MQFNNVEELKSFLDINGFRKTTIKNVHWAMCCCPFHADDNPSFGINVNTLKGHCFVCGWFEWNEILKEMGLPVDDELDQVDAMTGVAWRAVKDKLDFKNNVKKRLPRFELPYCVPVIDVNGCFSSRHLEYLCNRNFNDETINLFNLNVCMDKNSKYFDRIILPVNDPQGYLVFFDARTVDSNIKGNKYIRPSGSPVKYCLGGIDKIKQYGTKLIILSEGYLSMMKLWQFEMPAVCTFGANLHLPQVKMIMQMNPDHIILGYDADKAGMIAREKARIMLEGCGSRIHDLAMPAGTDPCDFKNKDEFFRYNKFLIKLY